MQYQLSDDLPSAPPFRLFPTIERDNGGRYRLHPPQTVFMLLFDLREGCEFLTARLHLVSVSPQNEPVWSSYIR